MSDDIAKPEELSKVDYKPTKKTWMDPHVEFRKGSFNYGSNPDSVEYLGLPFARKFDARDEDWKLPENWKEIIHKGLSERLKKYRSLQVFMDVCVRCGACADKCHYFLGSGDPKNMPVLRAELMRSVYRKDFTAAGKLLGGLAGARELTPEIIKEWFYYFYQCTECRRCSVFCPFGIDTAEITMMGRELLHLLGIGIDWISTPAANCFRMGNHLGIQPHGFKDSVEFAVDDLEEITGVRVEAPINKKGAEVLFVVPSADYFGDPHYFGFPGLPGTVSRGGSRLHPEYFRLRGREFRSVSLVRDDEAPQCEDLCGSQATGREVDHRGRVRPYVARAASVYGHHEWPGRLSRGAGLWDYRDEVRKRQSDEDGAHLRVHGGPDPQRKDQAGPQSKRSTRGLPSTTPAIPRVGWGSWRSRATC